MCLRYGQNSRPVLQGFIFGCLDLAGFLILILWMFWNTDDYWRTDASCKHQLRCLQNWRRNCMYVQLLFCTPTFTTQFTFTQFNNTGNNYLVLNIALISLNGKELYICMHILLKITQVFVIFASSLGNFGKYFSKICTLITQYFIYKNADSNILFAWVDRRHQGEEEKKEKRLSWTFWF